MIKVESVILAKKEIKVIKGNEDHKVHLVMMVNQEILDFLAFVVPKVHQVCRC